MLSKIFSYGNLRNLHPIWSCAPWDFDISIGSRDNTKQIENPSVGISFVSCYWTCSIFISLYNSNNIITWNKCTFFQVYSTHTATCRASSYTSTLSSMSLLPARFVMIILPMEPSQYHRVSRCLWDAEVPRWTEDTSPSVHRTLPGIAPRSCVKFMSSRTRVNNQGLVWCMLCILKTKYNSARDS